MKNNNKFSVSDVLIVGAGKSSRLASLRNKVSGEINISAPKLRNQQHQVNIDLKPETKIALEQAINLIDEKVFMIVSSFSTAKKNSLFKLRFGVDIGEINAMTFKQVFSLLCLDTGKIRQFKLIENLDSKGMLVVKHDK